jgi:hypothetical protein
MDFSRSGRVRQTQNKQNYRLERGKEMMRRHPWNWKRCDAMPIGTREDKRQAAEIVMKKQVNALTWLGKHIEIALLTGDTEELAGLRQEYDHLFQEYSK